MNFEKEFANDFQYYVNDIDDIDEKEGSEVSSNCGIYLVLSVLLSIAIIIVIVYFCYEKAI